MIRLQKLLSAAGVTSRRKAEEMIEAGRVSVNGEIAKLGTKADPMADIVEVDGRVLESKEKVYIMLHKPEGVVTTVTDPFGRTTVMDIMPGETRLFPVGRLDTDTSGLLLLTNDGDWAQKIAHPKHEIKKTYVAVVKGIPAEVALRNFRKGVIIDGRKTSPAQIKLLEKLPTKNSKLLITIHEGRNRQVRNMCEAIGHKVVSLKRVQVGGLLLDNLQKGKWRHLSPKEVRSINLSQT